MPRNWACWTQVDRSTRRTWLEPRRNWCCGWLSLLRSACPRPAASGSNLAVCTGRATSIRSTCHLFRFTYVFGDAQYTNVGIAGPACYAFGCDLSDLPPDDIFAAFAGWHAEHDEMYEFAVTELHEAEHAEVARLARRCTTKDTRRFSRASCACSSATASWWQMPCTRAANRAWPWPTMSRPLGSPEPTAADRLAHLRRSLLHLQGPPRRG
jgi:hypothetical protein